MLELLINYFYSLFSDPEGIFGGIEFEIGSNGATIAFSDWLVHTLALISFIIILVLCCLFIGKLVKGVAHLITR